MKIITGKVTNAVLQNIDNQTITMVAIETSKNQSITFPMDTTYTPYIQLCILKILLVSLFYT